MTREPDIESLRGLNNELLADCARAETVIERLRTLWHEGNQALRAQIARLQADNIKLAEENLQLRQIIDGYMRAALEPKP